MYIMRKELCRLDYDIDKEDLEKFNEVYDTIHEDFIRNPSKYGVIEGSSKHNFEDVFENALDEAGVIFYYVLGDYHS